MAKELEIPVTREAMPAADRTGTHGQAWHCNRPAALRQHRIKPHHDPVIADWIVSAPPAAAYHRALRPDGSHHLVHSCHIALMHLRAVHGQDAIEIAVPGATHELWVMAFDPLAPRDAIVHGRALPVHHYYAQVFAAQIVAADDAAAIARVSAAIALILNGDLNPVDQPQWIEHFGDAMIAGQDQADHDV